MDPAHVRTVLNTGSGTAATAPAIDEARVLPRWVVGMDVTADTHESSVHHHGDPTA